ncbi:MAG: hypothetical protein Q8R90_02565 [Bacteroidales bacterium]|nr:hypothetical protein [Bacteroidales bacterium]
MHIAYRWLQYQGSTMKMSSTDQEQAKSTGLKPETKISKIGIASRDYNQNYNGYRDFSQSLESILNIFDSENCDAILFSLFSICPRQGFSIKKHLNRLSNVKLVLVESFRFGESDEFSVICNHAYHKDCNTKEWDQYDYNQKFGSLSGMKEDALKDFVSSEIPQRIFGNSLSILCGETNIVKYSQAEKKVKDTYRLLHHIPKDVQIILNPIHDRMTRFEMKLKRKFLSKNRRWVISVWNRGKADKNGVIKDGQNPAWTVFFNEKEVMINTIDHNLGDKIELGIVDTSC